MNEPLKDKEFEINREGVAWRRINENQTKVVDVFAYIKLDVKSAVEWLKEQIVIRAIEPEFKTPKNVPIFTLIDEAFPDLCPSSDLIADKQNPQIDDRPCKVCHNKLTQHSRFYDNHTYEPAD